MTTNKPNPGGNCYRPTYERGPWFELKCVREVIDRKEARGQDASHERDLYTWWLVHGDGANPAESYQNADKYNLDQGFYGDLVGVDDALEVVSKIPTGTKRRAARKTANVKGNGGIYETPRRGRPRKQGDW